jgi:hypothetical protein
MELYLHSLTRLNGMMLIHMLDTKFHGVTSQKAAVRVTGHNSHLLLLCIVESAAPLALVLQLCLCTFTLISAN